MCAIVSLKHNASKKIILSLDNQWKYILMKKTTFYLLFIFNIFMLNGCGLAVKGIADTAIGGSSDLLIVEPIQDLRSYTSLTIIPFTNSIGRHLDTELLVYLNEKVSTYNSQKSLKQHKGKMLLLSGTILHLTDGVYEKQILLQLEFKDQITGRSLGLINVMGEANSIRGLTTVIDSLADSVSKLLVENHFPAGRNQS